MGVDPFIHRNAQMLKSGPQHFPLKGKACVARVRPPASKMHELLPYKKLSEAWKKTYHDEPEGKYFPLKKDIFDYTAGFSEKYFPMRKSIVNNFPIVKVFLSENPGKVRKIAA